ncbi:hypothetical protein EPUL_000813 [Erysiphe pulchra]|uniref:Uncharacterized protein n=1 Tax=Erysiphe pulchra TaxID=225359 RepID=A0A2S4Q186_9PEZI|nr:hypothetical protein EPUL_000813 [Erysiphe pulchra]
MALDSKTQSRSSSPHCLRSKLLSMKRPKLMRVATTAPSLQTSVTQNEAQYSQSLTRATALLTRMAAAATESRQVRGGSIGSVESSYSSSDEQQSPTDCTCRKDNNDTCSPDNSENYFSFPDFDDFAEYQE